MYKSSPTGALVWCSSHSLQSRRKVRPKKPQFPKVNFSISLVFIILVYLLTLSGSGFSLALAEISNTDISEITTEIAVGESERLDVNADANATALVLASVLPRHQNSSRRADENLENGRTANLLERIGLKATLIEDEDVGDGKPHDKTFFGEDPDGNPVVVGTWFQYGSYTLAVAMFGTAFMVACAVTAVYYVIFVVTDPRQSRSMSGFASSSISNSSVLEKLLTCVELALDVYEKLDIKRPDCQRKLVCEVQESRLFDGNGTGSLFRRILHNFINADFWSGSQSEKESKVALEELRRADRIGLDTEQRCSDAYAKCQFSLDEFHNKFRQL